MTTETPNDQDLEKIKFDLIAYGQSFTMGGKHIPITDVYEIPPETEPDNTNVEFHYGLIGYVRERLKGNKSARFIGWREGIFTAIFEDYNRETL